MGTSDFARGAPGPALRPPRRGGTSGGLQWRLNQVPKVKGSGGRSPAIVPSTFATGSKNEAFKRAKVTFGGNKGEPVDLVRGGDGIYT